MNISLTPELEQYIDKQVKSGLYHSSSEVIRAALRLLLKSDTKAQNFENYKMWLNQEIKIGLDQASRNELIPADQVFQNLKTLRKQMNGNDQK